MGETVPCRGMFSNGTEYEWFLENFCFNGCKRFRNGYCRTFRMTEKARYDKNYFPYDDLLDYKVGGKVCKRYTTEPIPRKATNRQIEGQISMEVSGDE